MTYSGLDATYRTYRGLPEWDRLLDRGVMVSVSLLQLLYMQPEPLQIVVGGCRCAVTGHDVMYKNIQRGQRHS